MTAFLSEPKKDCPMCGGTGLAMKDAAWIAKEVSCPCTKTPDGDGPDD